MAVKKVVSQIKLQIPGGQASPAPPVGPALGQHGLNIMDFCKQFNAKTQKEQGTIIPVVITVYSDKSFTFITKNPPVSVLIKKALNLDKGSAEPNRKKVGKLKKADVKKIAQIKIADLNTVELEMAMKIVEGTARSMGVEIEE